MSSCRQRSPGTVRSRILFEDLRSNSGFAILLSTSDAVRRKQFPEEQCKLNILANYSVREANLRKIRPS